MDVDAIAVRSIALADVEGYRACVDAVMCERQFLANVQGFSLTQTAAFVAGNLENGLPHFVAEHKERIIGWCDIRRFAQPVYAHIGELGIGLYREYRGQGLGERLIRAVLGAARSAGFERIELAVYAKNVRAMALYRKTGFQLEGTRRRARKLDGEYDDVQVMGLLL